MTHIGHASYLVQAAGHNIVIDPVWAERASPVRWAGPRRHNAPAIAIDDLPPIHAVLVSHNHYDHLDTSTLLNLWKVHRPHILTPLGNDVIIREHAPEIEVLTGDWWTSFSPFSPDVRLTIVPSYHWSSRWIGDIRMALWGGFIVETRAGIVYCAGDTAYREGAIFKEIGKRFSPPDVAILPIGAYAPRWFIREQHCTPAEAVQIAEDCGARQMLGLHWGTFALTDEPFHEPFDHLGRAVQEKGLEDSRFKAVLPGDIWELP